MNTYNWAAMLYPELNLRWVAALSPLSPLAWERGLGGEG
jgi:hypothetical protein